jgi:nicotinamidase-related amidase
VAGTHGGDIHEALQPYACEELTFDKGCEKATEQYSGFEGVNEAGQSLGEILELLDTEEVYVCGIATEYCVRNTCEDLLKAGFKVRLLKDCLAFVDHAGHLKALEEMGSEGIRIE